VLVDGDVIVLGFQVRDAAVVVFQRLSAHIFID
jgi:hypothetical protein